MLGADVLPPANAPPSEQQAALERLARTCAPTSPLRGRAEPLAPLGGPTRSRPGPEGGGWMRSGGSSAADPPARRPVRSRRATDPSIADRRLRSSYARRSLAAAVGIGAYPVVRRLTRRLERLRSQGSRRSARGELSPGCEVRGQDEIAGLARSFNRAAERIEKLVSSQIAARLASASHELRSPLARIRVAIELVTTARKATRCGERGRGRRGRARRADRGGAARQPPRRGDGRRDPASRSTCSGSSVEEAPRRAPTRSAANRRCGGQPAAAAPAGARPARERAPVRRAAVEVRVAPRRPRGGALGPRSRTRRSRRRSASEFSRRSTGCPATPESSGAGLGLSLVRQIAGHHGGEARYLGHDGSGSGFAVTLPGVSAG